MLEDEFSWDYNDIGDEISESRPVRIYNPIESIPEDFVAIDFETAYAKRCSPCSVGIAIVRRGKIIDSFQRLIKPHEDYAEFNPYNVGIHGITPEMVEDAPCFNEVMQDILPIINDNVLVAHNMVFDCSVLCHTLDLYKLPKPTCRTLCTCNLSRIVFPELSCHRLNVVSSQLQIDLEHHNAASDALACANILLSLPDKIIPKIRKAEYSFGYINEECSWSPQFTLGLRKNRDNQMIKNMSCNTELFCGQNFVFTGTLKSMERETACAIVEAGGGHAQASVNKYTNYLVMGVQDFSKFIDGKKSSKTKKAEELTSKGYHIKIISEDDFLKMIKTR